MRGAKIIFTGLLGGSTGTQSHPRLSTTRDWSVFCSVISFWASLSYYPGAWISVRQFDEVPYLEKLERRLQVQAEHVAQGPNETCRAPLHIKANNWDKEILRQHRGHGAIPVEQLHGRSGAAVSAPKTSSEVGILDVMVDHCAVQNVRCLRCIRAQCNPDANRTR